MRLVVALLLFLCILPTRLRAEQTSALINQQLVETIAAFAIENRLGDRFNDRLITVGRNTSLSDALEAIAQQTEGTWYTWEKSIVIVPKEEQIRNQLNKTGSVRWDSVDID